MIVRKSQAEIETMREAGRVTARALSAVGAAVRVGVTTGELDDIAATTIREAGAFPAFKGYHGFPATICASRNSVVVHGIPGSERLVARNIGMGKPAGSLQLMATDSRSSANRVIDQLRNVERQVDGVADEHVEFICHRHDFGKLLDRLVSRQVDHALFCLYASEQRKLVSL